MVANSNTKHASGVAHAPQLLELPPGHPVPSLPERTSSQANTTASPLHLLTARDLLERRPDLLRPLRTAGWSVRVTDDWSRLLEVVDKQAVDVVVVDLDAAQQIAQQPRATMSGFRLVALLARRAERLRFVLVVQTALDFSEIDDLMRQGVDVLLRPDASDEDFARHIQTAARRGGTVPTTAPEGVIAAEQSGYLARWQSDATTTDAVPPAQ